MFYLLLIIPHLTAISGLLFFAYRSGAGDTGEERPGGSGGSPVQVPPRGPRPGPSGTGPPLPDATAPRRRMRVGGRLSELHPGRLRREHAPSAPERTPSRTERGLRHQ